MYIYYMMFYFLILIIFWIFFKNHNVFILLFTGSLFILITYYNFNMYSLIILILIYLMLSLIIFEPNKTLVYKNVIFISPIAYLIYRSELYNLIKISKNLELYNNIFVPIISMLIFYTLSIIIIYKLGTNKND